ncbi:MULTISPECIES: hypothetical protein [unclassified Pseudomonas]|uniref:hypothetical protein n=1 Tax=unclassified Pseudomonas TaxID=196821 RepID=UPI000B875127|nr:MULTISPECIES: hypothetical protein [unclassified Pseudomonas]
MSKYEEYDQILLTLIDDGFRDFDSIVRRTQKENVAFCGRASDSWRVPDRRLQALRKAGKIAFDHGRRAWYRVIPE